MDNIKDDEIDLVEILKKIYKSRKLILYVTLLFAIIGLVVGFTSPVVYNSSTIFIPQNQEPSTSSLSGVASLVGINLGSSYGGEIPISMYPKISESPKFKRLLLKSMIEIEDSLTLKNYLVKKYNIENEKTKEIGYIYVSKSEERLFKLLTKILTVNVSPKDGYVIINSKMPIAKYSAAIANNAREILQKIIVENKIESAKQNLNFVQEQLVDKKIIFDSIQSKLSYFKDSNLNLVNSLFINEQEKLEAEFQIINAVVTDLSKEVEQAKLQVTKDTPVFSTISEAFVPNERTSPVRRNILIVFSFIGLIISSIYVMIKDTIKMFFSEIIK